MMKVQAVPMWKNTGQPQTWTLDVPAGWSFHSMMSDGNWCYAVYVSGSYELRT